MSFHFNPLGLASDGFRREGPLPTINDEHWRNTGLELTLYTEGGQLVTPMRDECDG